MQRFFEFFRRKNYYPFWLKLLNTFHYDNYSAENKIDKDLAFLEILAKEEKRRGEIEKEEFFIIKLALKIYPCFVIEYPSEADGH